MKLFIVLLFFINMENIVIYDFSSNAPKNDWKIVDDGVMGGLSRGSFSIDADGNGVFSGKVSLENNGGFSSVRYPMNSLVIADNTTIYIRLKGDGKEYQFRIKDKSATDYSYITSFTTSGDWETIAIKLSSLYPSFRGRKLDLPNFNQNSFEEIAFLIGNKKNESFQLILDKIELK